MSVLRQHAEEACAEELERLAALPGARPAGWRLSPRAVRSFLMGDVLDDGFEVSAKYIGEAARIEVAIATLATDRALLLEGEPGTGKSWVSEHLAAAISGDSTLLVQGSAGTDEAALRYGWNYARLLADGPSDAALVPSPVMAAMRAGGIVRVEELTRVPSEVQDALLGTLSEKAMPVPELGEEVQAQQGFNLIATANTRDRGVNALSSALRRRFAVVHLPSPASLDEEVQIVQSRLGALASSQGLGDSVPPLEAVTRVVTVFRELREGRTEDGRLTLKKPSGTLSAAEAIGVLSQGWTRAVYYGDGTVTAEHLAHGIVSSALHQPRDAAAVREYVQTVLTTRTGWSGWAQALLQHL